MQSYIRRSRQSCVAAPGFGSSGLGESGLWCLKCVLVSIDRVFVILDLNMRKFVNVTQVMNLINIRCAFSDLKLGTHYPYLRAVYREHGRGHGYCVPSFR